MKHPYADILQAVFTERKQAQVLSLPPDEWLDITPEQLLSTLATGVSVERIRIKPATITLNGVDCEAPVKGEAAQYNLAICKGSIGGTWKTIWFATQEARDAAYAALIKPFESAS